MKDDINTLLHLGNAEAEETINRQVRESTDRLDQVTKGPQLSKEEKLTEI